MATQHVRRSALADAVPVSQARILGDRIRDRAQDRVSSPMVGKGRVVGCVPARGPWNGTFDAAGIGMTSRR